MEEPREGNPRSERGVACTSSLLSVATMEGSLAEVASVRRKLRWRPATAAAAACAASRISPASMQGGVHQGSPGNGQNSVLLTPHCVFLYHCVSPPPPCLVLLATAQCPDDAVLKHVKKAYMAEQESKEENQ